MSDADATGVWTASDLGVVVVDHGSRREASNQMLLEVVRLFQDECGYAIVEPAHMELAQPSLADAFERCVQRGARRIVVHPYFLLPGRHSREDIPALSRAAASKYPDVPWRVSEPLGLHRLMCRVMADRIEAALTPSVTRHDSGIE